MVTTTIADLTVDQLRSLIYELVDEKITEILDDEAHLELTDELKARLLRQRSEIAGGAKTISSRELAAELSLD